MEAQTKQEPAILPPPPGLDTRVRRSCVQIGKYSIYAKEGQLWVADSAETKVIALKEGTNIEALIDIDCNRELVVALDVTRRLTLIEYKTDAHGNSEFATLAQSQTTLDQIFLCKESNTMYGASRSNDLLHYPNLTLHPLEYERIPLERERVALSEYGRLLFTVVESKDKARLLLVCTKTQETSSSNPELAYVFVGSESPVCMLLLETVPAVLVVTTHSVRLRMLNSGSEQTLQNNFGPEVVLCDCPQKQAVLCLCERSRVVYLPYHPTLSAVHLGHIADRRRPEQIFAKTTEPSTIILEVSYGSGPRPSYTFFPEDSMAHQQNEGLAQETQQKEERLKEGQSTINPTVEEDEDKNEDDKAVEPDNAEDSDAAYNANDVIGQTSTPALPLPSPTGEKQGRLGARNIDPGVGNSAISADPSLLSAEKTAVPALSVSAAVVSPREESKLGAESKQIPNDNVSHGGHPDVLPKATQESVATSNLNSALAPGTSQLDIVKPEPPVAVEPKRLRENPDTIGLKQQQICYEALQNMGKDVEQQLARRFNLLEQNVWDQVSGKLDNTIHEAVNTTVAAKLDGLKEAVNHSLSGYADESINAEKFQPVLQCLRTSLQENLNFALQKVFVPAIEESCKSLLQNFAEVYQEELAAHKEKQLWESTTIHELKERNEAAVQAALEGTQRMQDLIEKQLQVIHKTDDLAKTSIQYHTIHQTYAAKKAKLAQELQAKHIALAKAQSIVLTQSSAADQPLVHSATVPLKMHKSEHSFLGIKEQAADPFSQFEAAVNKKEIERAMHIAVHSRLDVGAMVRILDAFGLPTLIQAREQLQPYHEYITWALQTMLSRLSRNLHEIDARMYARLVKAQQLTSVGPHFSAVQRSLSTVLQTLRTSRPYTPLLFVCLVIVCIIRCLKVTRYPLILLHTHTFRRVRFLLFHSFCLTI